MKLQTSEIKFLSSAKACTGLDRIKNEDIW
jgi:hypothetical protein